MPRVLPGWFRHLTIAQKLLVSFTVILSVLVLSVMTLLIYLARVNSYVDRHQRITVPAVITAAETLPHLFRLREEVHAAAEHAVDNQAERIQRIASLRSNMAAAIESYQAHHAARTHPILFDMLVRHHRVDLAESEDRTIADILTGLNHLRLHEPRGTLGPAHAPARGVVYDTAQYDSIVERLERNIMALIDIHRRIDTEMKLEGDRLVTEARLFVFALTAVLAALVIATYIGMRRSIAIPLRRLALTADRVAHHDLGAQFESWPHRDEVGVLTASLSSMVANLRDQAAALMRKTKELEAFTYSVAHDLKGPLREIEGFSALLDKRFSDSADTDTRHHVKVIRKSVLRLTTMIEALLRYSRLEQQELPRQRFNVVDTIHSLIGDRFRIQPASDTAIRVDLPFQDVYGEPVSVRQALANLLDNAVKFSRGSPHPEIIVGGNRTPTERVLWIRDNGIGLDPAHHQKIFGLFERLHGPDDYEGTGVGLAIVKLIMEKHGGRVWVDSIPGAGSTFYLAFPEPRPT